MNHTTQAANPFYANRGKRVAPRQEERDRPVYARLPPAPRNASPVPHLTSLYHFHRAGEYGDRSYPRDSQGRIGSVSYQPGGSGTPTVLAANVTYMPFGPVSGLVYGNGLVHAHTYDLDYRLTGITTSAFSA